MEYNNNVNYQWKPDDKFEFSGLEFSLLVNASRDFLNTESSQKVLMVKNMYDILEDKLKKGVETGIITPVEAKIEQN
jgi:hypothetical protein